MKTFSVHYLCVSGDVKRRAEEHRAAYIRLKTALWRIVEGHGCSEADICDDMMLLRGVRFPGAVPPGWTKPDRLGCSRPKKCKENAAALKHFTPGGCYTVKTHPDLAEFWTWLACPTGYSYTKGPNHSGTTRIGGFFHPLQALWYSKHGPICLVVPDVERERADVAKEGKVVIGSVLDWKPPKGLKRILPQKWDLMKAEYELTKTGEHK